MSEVTPGLASVGGTRRASAKAGARSVLNFMVDSVVTGCCFRLLFCKPSATALSIQGIEAIGPAVTTWYAQKTAKSSMALKSVNIRIDEVLLQSIDQAASAAGMDRSNWMRLAFTERLRGRGPEMVDQIEVVDERARDIVKDMLSRLERLETKAFPSDPFDA